jgi:ubiquinone/menaquinone biosynthesis C-methylase UbiE
LGEILRILACVLLGIVGLALVLHLIVRVVRAIYRFPMPQFAANLIDNPLRRRWQPPDQLAARHGLAEGMTVLDVGPGNGTYTLAAARRVGETGKVVAVDIEPRMVERVERRIAAEGVTNVEARVADVYELPFDDETFDAVYLITVIGEIPQPERAMREFQRVLAPAGTLAFSELLPDPDYPRPSTLRRLAIAAGFKLKSREGNLWSYTLLFEKEQ